jgi:hypothetical protein
MNRKQATAADIVLINHDRTFAGAFQSITHVTVNGYVDWKDAMEVTKRTNGTWGMEWAHKSYREEFATKDAAIEAAIPLVLANENRIRGF